MLGCPANIEGPAVFKDEHYGLARGDYRFKHLLLDARQIERGARSGFAAHAGNLAKNSNDNVGVSLLQLSLWQSTPRPLQPWGEARAYGPKACRGVRGRLAGARARRRR